MKVEVLDVHKTRPFQYSKIEFFCSVRQAEVLVRERGNRATQMLGAGMHFPPYCLNVFIKNNEWEPFCYWCWAMKPAGFLFHWSKVWFFPTPLFPNLEKTSFVECLKLVLDSDQTLRCEMLRHCLCSDHSRIFFFSNKHSWELFTTITFLIISNQFSLNFPVTLWAYYIK